VGSDLVGSDEWTYHLDPAEILELESAMSSARSAGKSLYEMTREDFPIRGLARTLGQIAEELENGRGFVLMRGLPVERLSEDEASTIYWGLGCHLGVAVSQHASGERLEHIRDTGSERGYSSSKGLGYHSDGSDVVGLLCLRPARVGGVSTIASAVRVHDELLCRRPDLLEVLYQPQPRTHYGEVDPDQPQYFMSPLYSYHGGKLSALSTQAALRTYKEFPEIGPMDHRLPEALELVQALASEFHLDMDFQPGDIQLLNNYVIMHSRTEFVDWAEPERRRHLLRMWLTLYNGRELAPGFGYTPGFVDPNGGRGGVWRRIPGS
jgi:hypothetical protein